jgi:plasmid stability protein
MPKKVVTQQKGGAPHMRPLLVRLPEEIVRELKVRAAQKDRTVKAMVEEALRRYLGIKEGGESGKK